MSIRPILDGMSVEELVREVMRFGGKLKCLYLPSHEWAELGADLTACGWFYIGNCEIREARDDR